MNPKELQHLEMCSRKGKLRKRQGGREELVSTAEPLEEVRKIPFL